MHDSFFMRGGERFRNLFCNAQRFVHRKRTARDAIGERVARHQFHDQEAAAFVFLEAVNRRSIGMIQRREHARLRARTAPRARRRGQTLPAAS